MNNWERIIDCTLNKPIDRSPFSFYFGPWRETVQRRKNENGKDDNAWIEGFGFDEQAQLVGHHVNQLHYSPVESNILERKDNILIWEDWLAKVAFFFTL